MLEMNITFKVILDEYAKEFSWCDTLNSGYNRWKRRIWIRFVDIGDKDAGAIVSDTEMRPLITLVHTHYYHLVLRRSLLSVAIGGRSSQTCSLSCKQDIHRTMTSSSRSGTYIPWSPGPTTGVCGLTVRSVIFSVWKINPSIATAWVALSSSVMFQIIYILV